MGLLEKKVKTNHNL